MSRRSLEAAIPPGDRLLLDSSALIAYLNGGEAVFPVARHIIDAFVYPGRNPAIVAMVNVMEVLVRPLRLGVSEPYAHVLDFLQHFPHLRAVSIDLPVAQEAAALRATHGLSAPDALIMGTALVSQVGVLVTNDRGWQTKLRPLGRRIAVCYLADHLPFDDGEAEEPDGLAP